MARELRRTVADPAGEEADLRAQIEARAHTLYLERTEAGKAGDELSDWLAAEAEVQKQRGSRGH
jgi:hypothetical protein